MIDFVFLHLLRTGKYRTLKVWFCNLSTETPINKATQFFQKVNKIFRKNPARSGLQTQSVRERTWVKWGWRLKNRLKFAEIMQTKFVRRENSSKNSSNWGSFLDFQNMSNNGRRSSATKTSPDCQRNRNNNHPSPKTSQSYPKLSKEIYIELAAFSDSIYDRGRLFKEMLSNYISRS